MQAKLRTFENRAALTAAVGGLLTEAVEAGAEDGAPRAVMLPGGGTPQDVYRLLAADPPHPPPSSFILLSDDRLEPDDTPASNFHHLHPMLSDLG